MTRNAPTEAATPVVIAIGDATRHEFASTINWLRKNSRLTTYANCEQCLQYLARAPASPALIVWLQAYLGQFHESDLAALRAVEPQVAMICVYGAISEGELRTGKPLCGISRIPWYAWEARVAHLWRSPCGIEMPNKAAEDVPHHLKPESPTAPRPHPGDRAGEQLVSSVIGVASASQEMAQLLLAACQTAGHVGRWMPSIDRPTAPVEVAIWDDSCDARHALVPIDTFAAAVTPAPIIATMSFPRIDDYQRLAPYRVAFILGKPLMIEDLLWQIESLIKNRSLNV